MTGPDDPPSLIDAAWKERIEGKLDRLGDKVETSTSGIMAQLDFVAREQTSKLDATRTILTADLRATEKESRAATTNLAREMAVAIESVRSEARVAVGSVRSLAEHNERAIAMLLEDQKTNRRLAYTSIIAAAAALVTLIGLLSNVH